MTATREALDVDVSYYDLVAHPLGRLNSCCHFLEMRFVWSFPRWRFDKPGFWGLSSIAWVGHGLLGRALTPGIRLGLSFHVYL